MVADHSTTKSTGAPTSQLCQRPQRPCAQANAAPTTKLTSAWDRSWVFWMIGGLFGADWYLRRRWGLS